MVTGANPSAGKLPCRPDLALTALAGKCDEPRQIRFLAFGPDIGAEHASGSDRLVLLFEVAMGEEIDQLVKCRVAELCFQRASTMRGPHPVDRRRVSSEPVG